MAVRDEFRLAAAAFAEQLQHAVPCQCRWAPGQPMTEPPTVTECAYHAGQRLQLMRLVAEITQLASQVASKY